MDETSGLRAEIDAILADNGIALSAADVEAYMRDALRSGEQEAERAINRALLGRDHALRGMDQEGTLRRLAERLFTQVRRDYDAAEDRVVGALRQEALSLADRDLWWIRNLDGLGLSPREVPAAEIEELVELSRALSTLIETTNELRDSALDDESRDRLREVLRSHAETAAEIGARAEKKVDKVLARHRRSRYRTRTGRVPARAMVVLKVSLRGIEPAIWRRIVVPDNWTLLQLHGAIQEAMGWMDYHLHAFHVGEIVYSDPDTDEYGELDYEDEKRHRISRVLPAAGRTFRYEYDFGDSWEHTVKVEKRVSLGADAPASATEPMCLGGARACPPEDCGGVGGYGDLLSALRCPESERGEEMRQTVKWAGDWDPERFDVLAASRRMRELLG